MLQLRFHRSRFPGDVSAVGFPLAVALVRSKRHPNACTLQMPCRVHALRLRAGPACGCTAAPRAAARRPALAISTGRIAQQVHQFTTNCLDVAVGVGWPASRHRRDLKGLFLVTSHKSPCFENNYSLARENSACSADASQPSDSAFSSAAIPSTLPPPRTIAASWLRIFS